MAGDFRSLGCNLVRISCGFRKLVAFEKRSLRSCHQHCHKMTESESKYMKFTYDEKKSAFSVVLPGWSIDDVNLIARDLLQPHYLRTYRLFTKLEHLREIAKSQGFLGILDFEKTHATYMKCLDIERCVSQKELKQITRYPYGYDLVFESKGGRIGNTSFQIDNYVKLAGTGQILFKGALVYVTVDYKTKQPIPNPKGWLEKFSKTATHNQLPALRLNLQKPQGTETLLHQSQFQVRFAEVDRFGHTNNVYLNDMCSDAFLETFYFGKVPAIPSVEEFESGIKRIEVDFVGESGAGDVLTACVVQDSEATNKLFCKLYNCDRLIYVQALEYDRDIFKLHGKL